MSAVAEPVVFDTERARLLDMVNASWTTQTIRTACVLRLPDLLAAGVHDAQQIAANTGCHAPSLQRLLRALVTLGLCTEDARGCHALTPSGELLREDHPRSVRAWALLAGGPIWQRWGELDLSVRSGISHRRRHGGDDGFDDLALSPAAATQFYRAMVEMTRTIAGAVAQAIAPDATRQVVVDVGGGSGELLAQVLAAHPSLHGVLLDLPHGLEGSGAVLEAAGVEARCTRVAGSFFDPLPAGDLYLLKSVLHNWDDARCVQILQRCHAAMAPHGRVWVIERVMAERLGTTAHDRAVARSDLNMLVALSGRERTAREFATLFHAAGLAMQPEPRHAGEFSILQAAAA